MPETLAKLRLKKSGVASSVPLSPLLEVGELAINYADGKLFYKDDGGVIQDLVDTTFTNFTESVNSAAPNATIPAIALTVTNAATNADLVISPKGDGAILAHIPTNTSAGGNKRGSYAVDFQTQRNNATQVASGTGSVILGGERNTASGVLSVCMGADNTASGDNSGVLSGGTNSCSCDYSTICGGFSNDISGVGPYNTIFGGNANLIEGTYCAIVCGQSNSATSTAEFSTILNGSNNSVSGSHSVVYGQYANDYGRSGAAIHGAGNGTNLFQSGTYVASGEYSGSTINLGLNGSYDALDSAKIILPNNSIALFSVKTVAFRESTGDTKTWSDTVLLKRGANAAATSVVWQQNEFTQGTGGSAAWTIVISADTTAGSLKITASSLDTTTLITSRIESIELEY